MITGRRPTRSDSQPAISGIGTERTMSTPYMRFGRRARQADHAGQVEQREQVDDAEPATAAAEHRGEVDPAVVGVAEDVRNASRTLPWAIAARRSTPLSRTNSRIASAMRTAGIPNKTTTHAPAEGRDQRRADERDDDRSDVAAADVGADRKAAPLLGKLLGQQAVADRVLRRAADPRRDVDAPRTPGSSARRPAPRTRPRTAMPPVASSARRETIRVSFA